MFSVLMQAETLSVHEAQKVDGIWAAHAGCACLVTLGRGILCAIPVMVEESYTAHG